MKKENIQFTISVLEDTESGYFKFIVVDECRDAKKEISSYPIVESDGKKNTMEDAIQIAYRGFGKFIDEYISSLDLEPIDLG